MSRTMQPSPLQRRSVRSAGLVGVALLALAACGSSSTVSTADSTTSSSSAASTTSIVSTTLPAASTTVATPATAAPTTVDSSVCGDRAPAAGAFQVRTATGDYDGDGAPDTVTTWGESGPSGPDWYLRMQLASGVASFQGLGDLGAGFLAVLGSVDLDFQLGAEAGENEDEVVAIVGSTASGYDLGFFAVDPIGCVYQFVRTDGAGFFTLPVGATVSRMSGLTCDGGAGSRFAVALTADAAGAVWNVVSRRVERPFEGALELGAALTSTLPSGSSALAAYEQAECDGELFVGGSADF